MSEFPNLRQLSTLSPLPGFRTWLETQLSQQLAREPVCTELYSYLQPYEEHAVDMCSS